MNIIRNPKDPNPTSGFSLITFISLSLGFSGLLFGASAWNVWTTYQAFDKAIANQFKLQGLSLAILWFSIRTGLRKLKIRIDNFMG
jgi:hypothetical protein